LSEEEKPHCVSEKPKNGKKIHHLLDVSAFRKWASGEDYRKLVAECWKKIDAILKNGGSSVNEEPPEFVDILKVYPEGRWGICQKLVPETRDAIEKIVHGSFWIS